MGPGMFALAPYTIMYTARDKAGNKASCSFSFTVTGTYHIQFWGAVNNLKTCIEVYKLQLIA